MGKLFLYLTAERAVAEPGSQTAYGFLLFDGFSQLAFSAAVETLALANAAVSRSYYTWAIVTSDNAQAQSLAGIALAPDMRIDCLPRQTALVVLGGGSLRDEKRSRMIACLRRELAHGRQIRSDLGEKVSRIVADQIPHSPVRDGDAEKTGFSSVHILSRHYHEFFGTSPFCEYSVPAPGQRFVARRQLRRSPFRPESSRFRHEIPS